MAILIKQPLEIDVVVENVFRHLRLKDIIKQRCVCKLWHQIGTRILNRRIDEVQINFGSDASWDYVRPEKSIFNFLQMQEHFSFAFTNFSSHYRESNLRGRIPTARETYNLFNRYGCHMKTVVLELGGKDCWQFLSEVLTKMAPNVENLTIAGHRTKRDVKKQLFHQQKPELNLKSITFCSDAEYDNPIFDVELLTDLFQSSPHLESIASCLDEDPINHERLILETFGNNGKVSNIKCLRVGEIREDTLHTLINLFKDAPLEEFTANMSEFRSADSKIIFIQTFLNDHKDTLTSLHLTFRCVHKWWRHYLTFPHMTNLTELTLSQELCDAEDFEMGKTSPLGTFDFGQQFPKLRTLKFEELPVKGSRFFELEKMFPKQAAPLLTLKKLILPPQYNPIILRRIGQIFPNVEELQLMVQTPDVLKELWITWPKVKTLEITIKLESSFGASLHTIFTGIPVGIQSGNTSTYSEMSEIVPPSIGLLKELKNLSIKDDWSCDGLKITNETVRLFLAKLKELVFLYISHGKQEISHTCIQELCSRYELLQEIDNSGLRLFKYEWQKDIFVSML